MAKDSEERDPEQDRYPAEDWDPANPTPSGSRSMEDEDFELGRTLANYGEVEPGTTNPPERGPTEEAEGETKAAPRGAPRIQLDAGALHSFLDACMNSSPRVTYGLGAKVPFHGATPGVHFKKVDCSGFVREAIWRATTPHFNFKDGSVVQHDWIREQGFTRGTLDDAMLNDGAIRIVFLRQQDSPSHIGHVALVHNGRTLESHGGTGPNSRPWTKEGWQSKAFVYLTTDPPN